MLARAPAGSTGEELPVSRCSVNMAGLITQIKDCCGDCLCAWCYCDTGPPLVRRFCEVSELIWADSMNSYYSLWMKLQNRLNVSIAATSKLIICEYCTYSVDISTFLSVQVADFWFQIPAISLSNPVDYTFLLPDWNLSSIISASLSVSFMEMATFKNICFFHPHKQWCNQ